MKKTGRSRPSTPGCITARRLDAAEFMGAARQLDNDGYTPTLWSPSPYTRRSQQQT